MKPEILKHGTLVKVNQKGLLLVGPSGAGKSDLALRAIMAELPKAFQSYSATLIADDQVIIRQEKDNVWGAAPENLQGLIEVRNLGIQQVPYEKEWQIHMIIRLKSYKEIERLPDLSLKEELIKGVSLPIVYLDPFEPSSINKLLLASQTIAQ